VTSLCRKLGAAPPEPGAVHHSAELGEVRLRWERHTEFSTYTFYRDGVPGRPFAEPAIEAVAGDWVNRIPGERIMAAHMAFVDGPVAGADEARPAPDFAPAQVNGSRIAGGQASVWTDFRIRGDGYSRFLVQNHGMGAREAGYQVRRLLEIEGYRMLALLALPLIREIGPRLSALESELGEVTAGMQAAADESESDAQRDLARLTEMAAEIEHLAARANYRIAAARAYHTLVERRLDLLREERLGDLEPLGDYLDRRMRPAVDTFDAVRRRIADVAERVGRANALLRTRIDVRQATQSRDLLDSMNRRAGLQLRLEQAVEAITVIAGAYYLSQLLVLFAGAVGDLLPGGGLGLDAKTAVGLATPAIAAALWLAVRWLRARSHGNVTGEAR
jgi:uncharacterized membrane-anchored protein